MSKSVRSRSRRIRDPLAGINRNTARGREIRDLFASRMAAIAGAIEGEPDATLQAAVRRAVELQLLCERFRFAALNTDKPGIGMLEQVVRVENMVARADRQVDELVAKAPQPLSWWEQRQRDREEQEESENGKEE
jgi:hypothetical protein